MHRTDINEIAFKFNFTKDMEYSYWSDEYFINWESRFLPQENHILFLESIISDDLFRKFMTDENFPFCNYQKQEDIKYSIKINDVFC